MPTRSPELSALLESFTTDLDGAIAAAVDAQLATKMSDIRAKLFPARLATRSSPALAMAAEQFAADLDHAVTAAVDAHVAEKMTSIRPKLFPARVQGSRSAAAASPAVASVADQLTAFLERAITAVVDEELASSMSDMRAELVPAASNLPRLPAVSAATEQLTTDLERAVERIIDARVDVEISSARAGKSVTSDLPSASAPAQRAVRLCPVPGCGKPAAGPRYRWKCREHGALVIVKRVAVPAAPRVPPPLPVSRTATVIPADVKITRLRPGPVPRGQQSVSELRTRCRLPGCLEKNSGPRFDMFCRDHYAKLNVEERAKYKAMWKAAHAPFGSADISAPPPVRSRGVDSDTPYSARP